MMTPEAEFVPSNGSAAQPTFAHLVTSRKEWLEGQLKPWCQRARQRDLLLAEQEWIDLAGKVDPEKTLWAWAWNRFPDLVHAELGIDESHEILVTFTSGETCQGYADARRSHQGKLYLIRSADRADVGPFLIDDVQAVTKLA